MAEISWKSTFLGALILFLIGIVVATFLNYAAASVKSIQAGISGPFECFYNSLDEYSRINRTILCNETDFVEVQDCIYILVSYEDPRSNRKIENIKFSPSYAYDRNFTTTTHRTVTIDGITRKLGKCSAEYCHDFRFKDKTDPTKYRKDPELIERIEAASRDNGGKIPCYLNPEDPSNGTYLHLNEKVTNAEERIFRWYEALVIMIAALVITVAVMIVIFIIFLKGRAAAKAVQKPKEAFVPPGFAPMTSIQEASNNPSEQGDASSHLV